MSHTDRESREAPGRASPSVQDARRICKRELDRRAQRSARQRTKDRIAELEALLEESHRKDAGSARIASLLSSLAAVERERDQLASLLASIQATLHNGLPKGGGTGAVAGAPSPSTTVSDTLHMHTLNDPERPPTAPTASNSDLLNLDLDMSINPDSDATLNNHWATTVSINCVDPGTLSEPLDVHQTYSRGNPPSELVSGDAGVIMPPPGRQCDCVPDDHHRQTASHQKQPNVWRSVNKILTPHGGPLPHDAFMVDGIHDDDHDVAVRAVVEGWDSVAQSGMLSPSWAKLRPSQNMAHSHAIDYFVWAGVRERFVFSQHQYCSNRFWQLFSTNLRIIWPYEFQDCYTVDSMTGKCQISPKFITHIRNLNSWTMSVDFFNHFPDLYNDIPSYQEVPRYLNLPAQSTGKSPRARVEDEDNDSQLSPASLRSQLSESNNAFWCAVNIIAINPHTSFPWEMVGDDHFYQ
ncbi:hypothetical protein BX600DRAFT_503241 [Xylariales sp. PMI_506]|nr:hypothetical protein BX600DRAFT_503241 [Xylariales sp. PMI_506]